MGKLNVQGDLDIYNYLTASNTNLYLSSASTSYSLRFRAGTTEFLRGQISTSTNGTTHGTITGLYLFGPTYGNTAANIATAGKLSIGDPGPQIIFNCYANLSDGQPLALIYSDHNSIATGNSLSLVSSESNCTFIAPTIKALTKFIGTLDGNATSASAAPWTGITGKPDYYPVRQSKSSASNYRPLLMHYVNGGYGADPGTTNAQVYYNETIAACPSTGAIAATKFIGALQGNADTATKLQTARTISLTGSVTGSGSFDGSGNLSIATTTNHSHSYLPLSGGTVTGTLTLSKATDAAGTSAVSPALIIGGTATTAHIQMDSNEIMAKSNSTTPTTLYINANGGVVSIGSGGLLLSGPLKWDVALTNVTSPTVVAAYVGNDSANGLGFAYTSNLSVGYATNAGGISSVSPVLAAAGESNTLQAINNYDYYTNDTPIKHSLLGMIKALDFQWYTSHWRIGNLRSGSTASSGFGFAFSENNSTWNLRAYVGVDGFLWANKLGSYNYGSSLPGSGHKGEIFFKT